jgi:hypothetical protein
MKKVFLIIMFIVGVAFSASADVMNWFSESVKNRHNGIITATDDWAVALYNSATNELLFTSTDSPSKGWDDDFPGEWYLNVEADVAWNGLSVFTRFYDSKTLAGAQWYADSGVQTLSWTPSTPPAQPLTFRYDLGTISSTSWQVIPEPMTATVLVACAMMLGLKKLSRARQRD